MTPENTSSAQSIEREPSIQPEIVSFKDTEEGIASSGLLFKGEPGEVLEWGSKWVDNPARRTANTMIVLTESGNQYIIGRGFIINNETGEGRLVPKGADDLIPPLTFGEAWGVPGIFGTSRVDSVLAEYKTGEVQGRKADMESPFTVANKIIEQKILEAQEDVELSKLL